MPGTEVARDWVDAHCLVVGGAAPPDPAGLMRHVEASGAQRVVLFIHGGLVSEAAGIQGARHLASRIDEADGIYPLFLIWRTGVLEMLPQTLHGFLTEPGVVLPLLRWVLKLLGVDPVAKALELAHEGSFESILGGPLDQTRRPLVELDDPGAEARLESLMALDDRLSEAVQHTRAKRDSGLESAQWHLTDEFLRGLGDDGSYEGVDPALAYLARIALAVARQVMRRRGTASWHGWRDTAVEELIRAIGLLHEGLHRGWSEMKANAARAYAGSTSPGAVLARELAGWAGADASRELHLVAHSAGSFHVGHLLAGLPAAPAPLVRSLHLLAPACDHAFAEEWLAPARSRVALLRLYLLRQRCEDDEGSFSWTSEPLGTVRFYDGSLLNVLSGLLEAAPGWPLLGLERWLVHAPTGGAVRALFDDVLLAPTAEGRAYPDRCEARTHGAFDDERHTWGSVLHTIVPGACLMPSDDTEEVELDDDLSTVNLLVTSSIAPSPVVQGPRLGRVALVGVSLLVLGVATAALLGILDVSWWEPGQWIRSWTAPAVPT